MHRPAGKAKLRRAHDPRGRLGQLRSQRRKLARRLAQVDADISRLKPTTKRLAPADIDRLFDELTRGLPPQLPALPPDFSRDDLYDDHD